MIRKIAIFIINRLFINLSIINRLFMITKMNKTIMLIEDKMNRNLI